MTVVDLEEHDVRGRLSVAHLFPAVKGRCGVYRLRFAGGEEYVGQAVDVVRRFADHRRRWSDIVSVGFHRCGPLELDDVERSFIRFRADGGARLRNIQHVLDSMSVGSDLELVVTRDEQADWLAGDPTDLPGQFWLVGAGPDEHWARQELGGQRLKTAPAYARLRRSPLADGVTDALRVFVTRCVPFPRRTELTFWAASAAPSTNRDSWPRLGVVSVNAMEVLVLGHHHGRDELPWGFLNVRRSVLDGESRASRAARRRLGVEEIEHAYRAAAGDSVALGFDDLASVATMLTDPVHSAVGEAARSLVLSLMRQGPTLQWRWHCPDLVDHLLRPAPTPPT